MELRLTNLTLDSHQQLLRYVVDLLIRSGHYIDCMWQLQCCIASVHATGNIR